MASYSLIRLPSDAMKTSEGKILKEEREKERAHVSPSTRVNAEENYLSFHGATGEVDIDRSSKMAPF